MKISAIIADDRTPEGWPETYAARVYNADTIIAAAQLDGMIADYNANLRPGEIPRRLLGFELDHLDEDEAFNMGLGAFHKGKQLADNYFPAGHLNHQHWMDGWLEAEDESEDLDDEDESDTED